MEKRNNKRDGERWRDEKEEVKVIQMSPPSDVSACIHVLMSAGA